MKSGAWMGVFWGCFFLFLLSLTNVASAGSLIQKRDFVYLGAFRVPHGSLGGSSGPGALTLKSGATRQPLAFNPARNSLFINSYSEDRDTVEISIPEIVNPHEVGDVITRLNTATVIQVPVDLSNGHFDEVSKAGATVVGGGKVYPGGLMEYNGKIIQSAWLYYDASGGNSWRSHMVTSANWVTDGVTTTQLYEIGTRLLYPSLSNGGFVGGYMAKIPPEWQAALGAPALTGNSKIPIVSRGSLGPSLWAFDPGDIGTKNPTPATALVAYPVEHPTLGTYSDAPSLLYNRTGGHAGVIFPSGSDSIIVIGHHGLGYEIDVNGLPVSDNSTCTGAGTSSRDEVKTNAWLMANSPNGWICGSTNMDSAAIAGGDSCCLDPANTASVGVHSYPYVVGTGESCYGLGTADFTEARSNFWLKKNSPGGWSCGGQMTTAQAIADGDGCCYNPPSTDKGGKAYPTVYQMWMYDANDLLKVKNGELQPWDIVPTTWTFDLPFAPESKSISGSAYDSTTQRVYIAQTFGDGEYPLIHVFTIKPHPPKSLRVSK